MKKVTIQDVADWVGVSKTTISRYINGRYDKMSDETKSLIKSAIEELDYHPNRQAQSLKSYRSFLIGLVVADISNLYTAYLIQAMFDALANSQYQLIIMNANNNLLTERDAIQKLLNNNIDALILQPVSSDSSNYDLLATSSFPITLLDRTMKDQEWAVVQTDNIESTKRLARLLIDKGYQQVIHVTEPIKEVSPRFERYMAMKAEFEEKGTVELWEVGVDFPLLSERLKVFEISQKTAFFAANGNVLQKLLLNLKETSLVNSELIGVTGFDDWRIGEVTTPALTAIEQNYNELGHTIIELTLDQLNGEPVQLRHIIRNNLVERESL
ncbi:LacI family DNA-binding transcriptional regulator [Suicoccus acidiformans]|nr:LacI family DNA-binding transcriptional regulator [Suicoccus acidiformans]